MKRTSQRLAGLDHQAQQPRLATKTDVETYMKTHKRTEGAAADGGRHRDTCSARVDQNSTSLTSFGDIAEPFQLPKNPLVTL